jgi:xanthine dehydrogenase YagS FAD-binding subunit
MTIEELYALPDNSRRTFVTLPEGAIITAIILPSLQDGTRSTYVKAMARAAWGFALAGVAIVLEGSSTISRARVALSGVAPIPIRARAVEAALEGKTRDALDFDELSSLLVAEAQPLSHNNYKVALLRGVFSEALEAVCNSSS